jgi:hypothetical protein
MSSTAVKAELGPLVYVRFRPAWTYIDGIREFGRFFCERTFDDSGVAERAMMILQETLENAVKYSSQREDAEVELSLNSDGQFLTITVTSSPDPEHLDVLRTELALLNAQSPEEAYVSAFERAAGDANLGSRIGLARVRLEGNVELHLAELENGRITITARGRLTSGSPPAGDKE